MIRVLVVADSGATLASITASLAPLERVEISGYASGRVHIRSLARAMAPDVAIVDEMCSPKLALARIADIRTASPTTAIIALTAEPDREWIIDGLRAGAAAVVPRGLGPALLDQVLDDVVGRPLPAPLERTAA